MTIDTLPLAGSLLIATQHGPLVTVRIDGCDGEIVMGVDKWLALRATGDVLGAADKRHAEDRRTIEDLRVEVDQLNASKEAVHGAHRMRCQQLGSARSEIDALKQECERMRAAFEAAVKWRRAKFGGGWLVGADADLASTLDAIEHALSQNKDLP